MRFILPVSLALVITIATVPMRAGQSATDQAQVTFAKDVAPILQKNCQVCHRPGSIAPMSLLTYVDARPWARSIRQKVAAREMPPWFIDRNVGVQHFSNDVSLTDHEIATIVKWVDAGAPQGNPADMPPAREFPDVNRWQFGEPDLVVSLPKDLVVAASGPDRWPDFLVDPGLTGDRYIKGVQIIPTKGFAVIHHIRTSLVAPTDESRHTGEVDGPDGPPRDEQGVFLNEYAIGKGADVFAEGAGRLIKAGTTINISLHVHSLGTQMPTNVALGLKFHPKGYVPKHVVVSAQVRYPEIDIRPNTANVRLDGYLILPKAARLLSYQPHMHDRGKSACIEAIYPTKTGVLNAQMLNCARFFFNWHLNYVYSDAAAPMLPAGTVLHTLQWYDNTAANKFNPDPDAQITYGQRTIDEMAGAWISYYLMSDDEYRKEVEERRAQPTLFSSR